jgi:hypothetical protein
LATEAEEALATRSWDPLTQAALPEGRFDLVTLGHVLNELHRKRPHAISMRTQVVENALARVKEGGSVLVLEPALRETSRDLLLVRDALVAKGYALRAPCLWKGACPALLKESDWCHADRAWAMPKLVEELGTEAGLHKESLKMSYLVVAPKPESWPVAPEGRLFRIVSEPLEGKGRHRYIGCGPEGRVGLALQEKHRTADNEAFFHLQRGDVVSVTDTEPRGDGLSLTETSQARRVAAAGAPLPSNSK